MLAATSETRLRRLIDEFQFGAIADEIVVYAADCYSLCLTQKDDYSEVGNTRFGGDPDLPPNFEWPMSDTRYANFVGQINFAELPPLPSPNPLPSQGLLSLFVLSMDGASVPVGLLAHFHQGSFQGLGRRSLPSDAELCDEYLVDLVPHRVQAVPSIDLARYRKAFRASFDDYAEAAHPDGMEAIWKFLAALQPTKAVGKLLGFANASDESENLYRHVVLGKLNQRSLIYNDYWDSIAEYEAYIEQYKKNRTMYRDYQQMRPGVTWLDANRQKITQLVDEWQLLLRLKSNSALNLCINDSDPLYVFIRAEDLQAKQFGDLAGEVTQG